MKWQFTVVAVMATAGGYFYSANTIVDDCEAENGFIRNGKVYICIPYDQVEKKPTSLPVSI